ncbi:hypothetical protein [Actinocrispum sp. NPDC049592]|uniref:hypothetical protein n=1 Tax=Actinocrispum sp. NPDC049592 TaxID=3154835 RepID=UPI003436E146
MAGGGSAQAWVAALEALQEHGDSSDVPGLLAVFDDIDIAKELAERPQATFGAAMDQCLSDADELAIRLANTRLAEVFTDDQMPIAIRALAVRPFVEPRRALGVPGIAERPSRPPGPAVINCGGLCVGPPGRSIGASGRGPMARGRPPIPLTRSGKSRPDWRSSANSDFTCDEYSAGADDCPLWMLGAVWISGQRHSS